MVVEVIVSLTTDGTGEKYRYLVNSDSYWCMLTGVLSD